MKLVCGHNICRECLNQYSYTDNTESSIRCDVCAIETKVVLLSVSIANRAISSIMLDAQSTLGRRFYSGLKTKCTETDVKYDATFNEEQKVAYESRDPMRPEKDTNKIAGNSRKTSGNDKEKDYFKYLQQFFKDPNTD